MRSWWLLLGSAVLLCALPSEGARPRPRPAASARAATATSSAHAVSRVVRLSLLPTRIRLAGPLAASRLLVMGTRADGRQVDLTTACTFASSAPKIATVSAGLVVTRSDGRARLVARYGGLAASAAVEVNDAVRPVSYSFRNDVVPVLARLGCSAGNCHGANSGKGGFKLSLRGYAPELDYLAITRQLGGRRISREAPANSLFLRKPLMELPHGGGRRLAKGSREYDTLLGWLLEGAAGIAEKEPQLTGLTALPGDRDYHKGDKQQVLVQASFSDGHTEDVTDRAVFKSNDAGVAEVTEEGRISAQSPGATAVMSKYMGALAQVVVTVPYSQKINAAAFPPPAGFVDQLTYARLRELHLEPSPTCTDEEFLRRAYLDVLGTLPAAEEARRFLAACDAEARAYGSVGVWKCGSARASTPALPHFHTSIPAAGNHVASRAREHLIEELLKRPEYGSIWSLRLCDVFMVRKEHMERKNTLALSQWLTQQFQQNRPWDQLVTDLVTATGSPDDHPETLWWASRQQTRPNAHGWVRDYHLTGEVVAQVFLGQRIQCARCHNHPTEKYTQDDYYHFAAIFAQVNGDGQADPVPERFAVNDPGEVRQPRTGELMIAQPLDHASLDLQKGEDRRVKFARWLTGAGSAMFSRNIANRVWQRLFGSGLVDPVDDLRSTNPPRNEPLLDALAKDLITHHYDLKYLMGVIMRSRTYQASSTPTPRNRIDTQFFSHYPVKRLKAEELLDALAQATGVPDRFATYPLGTRAIELSDSELSVNSLDVFGRPARTTPCECDRSEAPSLSQALDLFNGEALQSKLKSPDGAVMTLVKSGKPDAEIIEELFLRALARRPTAKELSETTRIVAQAPKREEGLQDVLWALLNTKEFMFNH